MKSSFFTLFIALLFSATTFAQLTGIKTIPGDYPTVAAAIADLNTNGAGTGGVTFDVAAGHTETFATAVNGIITASGTEANPIVFQKSGEGSNPLITAGVGTTGTTATNGVDGIIVIAGGDYITFDAINLIENEANTTQITRMEFGYALLKTNETAPVDGCQYVTIRNCSVTLNTYLTDATFTNCTGIYGGNHTATTFAALSILEQNDAMNNSKFYNNTVSNVTYGIRITGWAGDLAFYEQNNEIGVEGSNTITNFNRMAINTRYQKNLKVANNIMFTNALPTNTLYGIYIQNTRSCDIYDNTVTLQPAPPATGAYNRSITCISFDPGEAEDVGNIYGNIVENCTTPETTSNVTFNGISGTASVETINMYSNIVRNNTVSGTGGFLGMDAGNPTNLELYDNKVYNNTKNGTSGTLNCLQVRGTGNVNAYGNQVYNNYNTTSASATQGGAIYGIYVNGGNPANIHNNMIYDQVTMGGGVSVVNSGIQVNNAIMANIYNNYVSDLQTPAAPSNVNSTTNILAGISMSTQSQAVNIFYNTIYLNAVSTGVNFFSAAVVATPSPVVDLRNNILVNLSTPNGLGVAAAYRRQSPSLDNYSLLSNANVFYAGEIEDAAHTVFFHGALSAEPPIPEKSFTMEQFQKFVGPARESGSFRHLPPFVNTAAVPYDLHLIDGFPTPCESGGVQITSPIAITTDFDGDVRSSAPDIGADEFNGIAISVINPGAVIAKAQSSHQIDVSFSPNPSDNDVVIVWSATGDFTAPAGDPPAPGEPFAGGTLLYFGKTAPASHMNLPGASEFFYKAFSYDGFSYSRGIIVSETTNIAPPSDFTATAVSESQIDLVWTQNSYGNDVIIVANDWDNFGQPVNGVVYAPGNELPDGGTVIYIGPLSGFSHTGLIPNITTYYYKAWSYDPTNMDIYSQTGVTATAATLCSSNPIPFYESFEHDGELGCGTVIDANDNFDTWYPNFGFARTGFMSLRINGGFGSQPKDDWYFTNGLELEAGKVYLVKFWYRTQSLNGTRHQIEVKWGSSNTPAGMNAAPIYYTEDLTPVTNYNTSQIVCIPFIPETTGIYWIGLHDFTPLGPGHALFVDDITIDGFTLPEPPTDFTATLSGVDIDLAYTKNVAGDDVIIATNNVPVFDNPTSGDVYQIGDPIGSNGTVVYSGPLSAYTHTNLESLTTYYYKIWSVSSANFYSTTGEEANATTPSFQAICSPIGWGGISSYMIPENADIEVVLANIEDAMQIIVGTSRFYWPSQNINTLISWDSNKGYKIKMNEAACFAIIGEMGENKTVILPKGAGYMPVLCDQGVVASAIFDQLGNAMLFAYDLTSQQLYWPMGQIYTLDTLLPGRAYLVNMLQNGEVTFGCEKSSSSANVVAELPVFENAPWTFNRTGSQHFISIHGSALAGLAKGDFIGVFNAQGQCMGLTQYNGQSGNLLLVAYGDDFTTNETDGLLESEEMSFRIFGSHETNVQVTFSASLPNSGKFADMGQSMITKIGAGATAIGEYQLSDLKLYPNPGSGVFTLDIPALEQRVTVQVENSLGQLIYSEMVEANQTGSAHKINLSSVEAGLYFVKISYQDETIVSKLIVR